MGNAKVDGHTMQTASTPSNQESLPFLTSARMNSSRPSEPDSSIPSKQKRRFTGRGLLSVWCASSTLTQPKMGPLSSDEPRPYKRPVLSSLVSWKGGKSQPSESWAYKATNGRSRALRLRGTTHGLDVKVTVKENCLFRFVVADPP